MRKPIAVQILAALVVVVALGVAEAAERLELRVDGMVCPFCEATVERLLKAQPGVQEADADFRTGTAVVVYDPARTKPETLTEAINSKTFYRARVVAPGEGAAAGKPAR